MNVQGALLAFKLQLHLFDSYICKQNFKVWKQKGFAKIVMGKTLKKTS